MSTIIFDFDGTLGDSFELAVDIAYQITGLPPIAAAEMARLRRLPLLRAVRELGIPLRHMPKLVLAGRQAMHERIDEVLPFAGIAETLQTLHEAGHHLIIMSSNSEENVRTFLRSNGMELYFDGVYGGVGLFNKAGALRKIMRRNHLQPEECYYVGDEVRDILAAKKVRVRPVSVAWGYQDPQTLLDHEPFALVYTPPELVEVFEAEPEEA